jgi:hypothetical protein
VARSVGLDRCISLGCFCLHVGVAALSASWMLGWRHRAEVLIEVLGGGGFDSVEYVDLVSCGR